MPRVCTRFSLGLLAALAGSCRGDYPLEPTPCDDWCDAVIPPSCENRDPAQCVINCEYSGVVPSDPECQRVWQAALDCYRSLPDGALGCFGFPTVTGPVAERGPIPCEAEQTALLGCQHPNGFPEGRPR